jgi:gamma-glutamyltranspeptidase/glutathione hydrolase
MAPTSSSTSAKPLQPQPSKTCTSKTRTYPSTAVSQGTSSPIPSFPGPPLTLQYSGVPGELRGLEHLHKGCGKLPWSTVLCPAINLARNGFLVTQDLVNQEKAATAGGPNFLIDDPSFAIDFAPNGTLLGLNETITRKRYADTLDTIAEYGPDAFYTGAIANATIQALRATGGTMTLQDLANYTVVIRKPAQVDYRGFKLTACSAPSSGTVALAVMKTVEGYRDFGQQSATNISTHRLDEAIRFAYGEVSDSFLLAKKY